MHYSFSFFQEAIRKILLSNVWLNKKRRKHESWETEVKPKRYTKEIPKSKRSLDRKDRMDGFKRKVIQKSKQKII